MRILKVVQSYYPFQEKGGPVVKVRDLAHALARREHQITVLTADWGLRAPNGLAMTFERDDWGWRATEDGVETVYLPSIGHYRALTLNPHIVGFCRRSLRDFDLVHFYGLYDVLGPAVSFFCRRRGLPYVIEPMGMYRPIDRGFLRKSLWHRTIGSTHCAAAAQFIATSELEREGLIEDGVSSKKLIIRHNGVDAGLAAGALAHRGQFRAKWNIPLEQPLLLFLSRLIPRKGADILIKAFSSAWPKSGRLVIAGPEGEPRYRERLERCAKESGVEGRVLFTGPLYDEEKLSAFADADIFALPSRYENFANVAAEAMACGIPVIVSDSCGIASLAEGQAGLVIPPRLDALTNALETMVSDKDLYARLKAGCKRVADQLSWNHLAAEMESHYERAIARSMIVRATA